MSMIINESLRLYPPVVGLMKKVESTKPWSANMGRRCASFQTREILGVANATKSNFAAFIPFGIMRPRNCIGFNFAITEAKIALTMILQRYAFTLSPAYVQSPIQVLTLRPQYGLQIMLHPLWSLRLSTKLGRKYSITIPTLSTTTFSHLL